VREKSLSSVYSGVNSYGAFFGPVMESYAGAWQQNVTILPTQTLLAFSALYACVTGIASDIAKMRIKLTQDEDGIWEEVTSAHGNAQEAAILPVLRKPNRYQTRIKFIEQWIVSKLLYGNAYILKERERARGPVTALYVLHPNCVKVLVAPDGGVYYDIGRDDLSGITESRIVPASEIIHDMMVSLWHPLIGVSPIYACSMSATMGNKIQANSTAFNSNMSKPGGILIAPGPISPESAAAVKASFDANYSGTNIGKIAVLGDGLKFEQLMVSASDSQLIEQLQWTVQDVARAFRYPAYKLDASVSPKYDTLEAYTLGYYIDCLQPIIESMELCLDEGLGLPEGFGTEMDLEALGRMDTATLVESTVAGVKGSLMTPNEGRRKLNLPPVGGGNSVWAQQQNYSLEALAKRDSKPDPFASNKPVVAPAADSTPKPPEVRSVTPEINRIFQGMLRAPKAA
jgi:HK97 family phage portal protein